MPTRLTGEHLPSPPARLVELFCRVLRNEKVAARSRFLSETAEFRIFVLQINGVCGRTTTIPPYNIRFMQPRWYPTVVIHNFICPAWLGVSMHGFHKTLPWNGSLPKSL